ncbi:SURF1 family protein [Sphingomonas sp. DT-204]|uniref:SURF1 family protein n=1 Tax=Sphingomonas sp. DT-204 TaxID=3396166 RepID=UPI003F1E3974
MTRHPAARAAIALALLAAIAGLIALGVWQLHRRTWKLALIAQVEHRLAAAPVAAPGPEAWPRIGRDDAYLRIRLRGTYQHDRETLVQAATELGGGYWVMTPLRSDGGFTVLVNRGFVPPERREAHDRPAGAVDVAGLLRVSEPGGGFLRANDPATARWYSRDVPAIAAAKHLGTIAPYFVDADVASSPGWPRGGLTVVRFPNNHLVYAITWFAMAALLIAALVRLAWRPHRV